MYLKLDKWSEALAIQDELDKINGYTSQSAILRVRIWIIQKKPKKALAEVNRYLEQDPTDVNLLEYKVGIMGVTKAKAKEPVPDLRTDPGNQSAQPVDTKRLRMDIGHPQRGSEQGRVHECHHDQRRSV